MAWQEPGVQKSCAAPGWVGADWGRVRIQDGVKHSFDRLIWLVDIARLANRIIADHGWPQALKTLEEWRLTTPAAWALGYGAAHLGSAIPTEVQVQLQQELNRWERRIETQLLRHERVTFLAGRLFARMLPWRLRPLSWWETIFPRTAIRLQMVGPQGGSAPCCTNGCGYSSG